MSEFFNTPIVVEPALSADTLTANARPVWIEIRHALDALQSGGDTKVIDLMAMPFGPGELDRLLEGLGRGEVEARINTLGETRVYESRFAGVWINDHYNTGGSRIALQIEVTDCPALLRTPPGDVTEAAAQMAIEIGVEERQ